MNASRQSCCRHQCTQILFAGEFSPETVDMENTHLSDGFRSFDTYPSAVLLLLIFNFGIWKCWRPNKKRILPYSWILCTFILPFRVVMFTFFSVFLFCPTYFVDAFYYSLEDDDAPVNSPKSWWIHRSICFAAHFSSQYSSKYWCCHIWISSIIMIINIKCIRMWCLRIYCEMILECVADFLIEWHRSYRVADVKR